MVKSILIYTTPEKLLHKQGRLQNDIDHSPNGDYYWALSRKPKNRDIERIYFATEGFVRGYFKIEDFDDGEIDFNCSSWQAVAPVPCKHFQGFKYYDGGD